MKKRILSFFLSFIIILTVFAPVPFLVSATVDDVFLPPEDFNLSLITVDSSVDSDYYNNISMQYIDIYKKVVSEIRENIISNEKNFNYDGSRYQVFIPFIDIKDYSCELIVTSGEMIWFLNDSGQLRLKCSKTGYAYTLYSVGFDSDFNYRNFIKSTKSNDVERFPGATEITFLPSFYRTAFPEVVPTPSIGDTSCGIFYVDVDIDSFSEWIINNKRYEDIANCGLDVATDKIRYLVDWWSKYGSSPARIVLNLPKLIVNINILSIDFDVISSVCKCIDNLYIEYKMYLNQKEQEKIRYEHAYWPGHLQEDDDGNKDYTHVTDTEEDDIYTKLLREILRTISALPDIIVTKFNYIQTYLDSFLIDFNRIINISVSSPDYINVLYEIEPENNPVLVFEDKISAKFPIIEQSQQIMTIEEFISDENKTPIITMKNPGFLFDSDESNDIILAGSEDIDSEITLLDFSKFDDVIEIIKNILSFFIILGFGHWTINYIPKLLAGYNESD